MISAASITNFIISMALGSLIWGLLLYIFLKNKMTTKKIVLFAFAITLISKFNRWIDAYTNNIKFLNTQNAIIVITSILISATALMISTSYAFKNRIEKYKVIKQTLILTGVLVIIVLIKIRYLNNV